MNGERSKLGMARLVCAFCSCLAVSLPPSHALRLFATLVPLGLLFFATSLCSFWP